MLLCQALLHTAAHQPALVQGAGVAKSILQAGNSLAIGCKMQAVPHGHQQQVGGGVHGVAGHCVLFRAAGFGAACPTVVEKICVQHLGCSIQMGGAWSQ